jgi:hypothetical protein
MSTLHVILLAAASCLAAVAPATDAAEGPVGIAYVAAPEQSSGVCVAGNADKAFACARAKCTAGGALARDCLRIAWCFPSGWSTDVFLQNQDGFHWHEFSCGWHSKEMALRAARLRCDRSLSPQLLECMTVGVYDPDGKSETPEPAP